MATKFPPGGLTYYNARGEYRYCYTDADIVLAKESGFTSAKYVRSRWPITMWHKATGESKPVGRLVDTDEKNAAAVAAMGPDWTTEHVAVPEPVAKKATADPVDGGMLASVIGEMALLTRRVQELEQAVIDADSARAAIEARFISLESRLDAFESEAESIDALRTEMNARFGAQEKTKVKA